MAVTLYLDRSLLLVAEAVLHSTTTLRILQVLVDLVEEHQVVELFQVADKVVEVTAEEFEELELLVKVTMVAQGYMLGILEVVAVQEVLVVLILLMAALEY
jgi:hypothetical protein